MITFRSSFLSGLFFITFLCMDMGGQQFFSAFRDEMDDGRWGRGVRPMHWGVPRWND